ncbi:YhgE/Pip domain-containing protein [Streptomyces sp. NPDC051546]|uniref:YhgE/Pip domain-containing protein n=1 Tax=Streptomyces sp. NPDC051546 TaxID=3365655 RepID=UPI00379B95D1
MTQSDTDRRFGVRAGQVLRNPRIWMFPMLLVSLVMVGLSLLYMGGVVNPNGHLKHVPIGVVNADRGVSAGGKQQNLGTSITEAIVDPRAAVPQASWRLLDADTARDQMESGKLYGTLVVPEGFTAAVLALGTAQGDPVRPTLEVLTNPGAGSLASSFASTIAQGAAHRASAQVGKELTANAAARSSGPMSAAEQLMLADPLSVSVRPGHPIGAHSGLGLTAFYYSLLLVMAGFMGGNIISNGVDVALGYADSEVGPWHTRRPTVPIDRRRTLLVKSVMSVALSAVTSTLIMLMCVAVLGIDASHLWLLWVFSFATTATVGLGVQAINAAFGGIGQLVSMFVFIVMALPSSGATVPLEALPGFYRWLAVFEPMRQLSGGVRAILYFDARADAGLTRAWLMIALGAVLALLFGFAATTYYDRKGLRRRPPTPEPAPAPAAGSGQTALGN